MYIDKLIKKEVITLLISVSLLVIIFIGVTYAKFLSVDKGQDTVINMGDLNISFCKDTTCDTTYTNIGQIIGTKVENGTTVPLSIYPYAGKTEYSNETPYIFKVENTGTLDSTVKIKLKEDDMIVIADAIKAAVIDKDNDKAMALVKSITDKYPLYA